MSNDDIDDQRDLDPDAPGRGHGVRRVLLRVGLVMVGMFLVMQLVPYGWKHSNPPVVAAAPWPDAESEQIARTSCYSCHSNETDWPVYSYVAPMSWLVRHDVDRARDEFNFSEWDAGDADDAVEMILQGKMPLGRYTMIHRDAKLTETEKDTLIAALQTMGRGGDDKGDGDDGGGGDNSGRGNANDDDDD